MARSLLDKELQELDAHIIRLGMIVDTAFGHVLESFAARDLAKAGLVIEQDALVDSLRTTIEHHAFRLLTLQQPLGGRDLRYLASVPVIASHLERIGDGAAGIAQNLIRMLPLRGEPMPDATLKTTASGDERTSQVPTEAAIVRGMLDLGKEAHRVLQGTMKAFQDRDVKAARSLWEEDDVVDVRYHMVRHDLMTLMTGARALPALSHDSLILQRATYLLWIAHKLERVGDHSTTICERILFIVEGDSSRESHPQANRGRT